MNRIKSILILTAILALALVAPALATCPGCGMEGGVCAGCEEHVREFLTSNAQYMCPGCSADKLCDDFMDTIDDVIDALPVLETKQLELAPMQVAYVEGTPLELEEMFGALMQAAVGQNLLREDTRYGSAYPTMLSEGYRDDMYASAFITLGAGQTAEEPLQTADIAGAKYLVAVHRGSYETLDTTWVAAMAYADLTGLVLGDGPAAEIYVNNPSNATAEELITEIYLPLAEEDSAKSSEAPQPPVAVSGGVAAPEMPPTPKPSVCPDCKPGEELCSACAQHATEFLSGVTPMMCKECKPGQPCAACQALIGEVVEQLPRVESEAHVIGTDPSRMAYIGGTFNSDRGDLYAQLVPEALKQQLFTPETMMCTVYPELLGGNLSADTPVYACVLLASEATPQPPLKLFTVPGGQYLNVVHHGSYDKLAAAWLGALAYAELRGLKIGSGPCAEVYFNNPQTTPEEKLLTELFLPLEQ